MSETSNSHLAWPDDYVNKIIVGDCLQVMQGIPDGAVDMILCDLPYGTTQCKWDKNINTESLWDNYKRIISIEGAIVLTARQPFTSYLIISNIEMFKYEWIWDKTIAFGYHNAKNKPMNKHESILVFSKSDCANKCHSRMNYNPQGLIEVNKEVRGTRNSKNDDIGHRLSRPSDKQKMIRQFTNFPNSVLSIPSQSQPEHPTQKPVPLFEYLIRTYTNENDIVLDNCLGSGTTAVASVKTGRRYIGIEISPEYAAIAQRRVDSVGHQLEIGM